MRDQTSITFAKRVAVVMTLVAAAASGAYTLIYLARWEWHRAIVAGIFFLASEIVLASAIILGRLRKVQERLDAVLARNQANNLGLPPAPPARDGVVVGGAGEEPEVLDALRETAPAPTNRFAWLQARDDQFNVFLPFLLGAGMVLSALAWAVEALARVTARPTLERHLAADLAPLALPAGGFLGPDPGWSLMVPSVPRRAGRRVLRAVAIVLLAGVVTVGATELIDAIADATQTRAEPAVEGSATSIDLHLSGKFASDVPQQAAQTLWATCMHVLVADLPPPQFTHIDGGHVVILVNTPLGENARRRLVGCLEDSILDKVQATVGPVNVLR